MTTAKAEGAGERKAKGLTTRKAKLNKWYTLNTRFKLVPAHIKDGRLGAANQYRLVIEFPREYRVGYFPFELQLRDGGDSRGLTNYWCNSFGEGEILEVIDAVERILAAKHNLSKLLIVKNKHRLRQFERQIQP